jgi:hypothetical protein
MRSDVIGERQAPYPSSFGIDIMYPPKTRVIDAKGLRGYEFFNRPEAGHYRALHPTLVERAVLSGEVEPPLGSDSRVVIVTEIACMHEAKGAAAPPKVIPIHRAIVIYVLVYVLVKVAYHSDHGRCPLSGRQGAQSLASRPQF